MTTISELLEQNALRLERGVTMLSGCYYNHIDEISDMDLVDIRWKEGAATEVEVHVFYEAQYDYRRSWVLFGVRFRGEWVMLCRNAGRELDDYSHRDIINETAYKDMITYIRQEIVAHSHSIEPITIVDPDTTEVVFEFYGHDVRLPWRY